MENPRRFSTNDWPLNLQGPWPYGVLSDAFLKASLFSSLPQRSECTGLVVRKALKVFLKRVLPNHKKISSDTTSKSAYDQDGALIRAVCDNPKARSRFSELELQKEKLASHFGRPVANVGKIKLNQDIASFLWTCILGDPSNQEVARWIMHVCDVREEAPAPYFLTCERLQNAGPVEDWPFDPKGEIFAQIVVLMSSKLSLDDAIALCEHAANIGSPYFEFFASERRVIELRDNSVERDDVRPKLADFLSGSFELGRLPLTDATSTLLHLHESLERNLAEAQEELDSLPCATVADLASASAETFNRSLRIIEVFRRCHERFAEATASVIAHTEELASQIAAVVGSELHISLDPTLSAVEKMKAADQALALAEVGAASASELDKWRQRLTAQIFGLDELVELAEASVRDRAEREGRKAFVESLAAHLREQPTSATAVKMAEELSRDELVALIAAIEDERWLPLKAILLRLISENGRDSIDSVTEILAAETPLRRRELLRFLSSTTSNFDESIELKRLVALEIFRDSLVFGPLAQVSDPAAGLSDVSTVGKTILDISDLLTEHLDLLHDVDDLRRLLREVKGPENAFGAYVNFAKAPVMMTGIYKRLREAARNDLFLSLCGDQKPSGTKVGEVIARIRSGTAADDVVASVSREEPNIRIEARHRTQLERYLEQGVSLLESSQNGEKQAANPRRAALRTQIQRLIKHLRSAGAFGSLEWLEGEVLEALNNINAPDQPTLLGDAHPFLKRRWTEDDNQWARRFVHLSELYDDVKLTGAEVFGLLLWWYAQPEVPSQSSVVRTLIAEGRYASALRAIDDCDASPEQAELLSLLYERVDPLKQEAFERLATLRQRFVSAGLSDNSAFTPVEEEIEALLFDDARERMDLLELHLIDAERARHNESESEYDRSNREKYLKLLLKAGVTVPEERAPVPDLELRWAEQLSTRAPERAHIILVESVLDSNFAIGAEMGVDIQVFRDLTEDPETWLSPEVAALFSEMLEPSVFKLRAWIETFPAFSPAAQAALITLLRWYLKFFLEYAAALNANDDEPIDGPLERVFEISEMIGTSAEPIICVRRLGEIGENLIEEVHEGDIGITGDDLQGSLEPGATVEEDAKKIDNSASFLVFSALSDAMSNDRWAGVLEALATAPQWDDAEKFAELVRLMQAQSQGRKCTISAEVAELASSISSEEMRFIPRAVRLEIAFRLVAVALDVREKQLGSSWADAIGQRSDAVKLLTALSGTNRRATEALMKGSLGNDISEKLWETATNTTEPQSIRTPLLLWLYERCSPELVLKLAQKHEPTLRERLEQLFEIRSVAVSRVDLVPVAQSLAAQVAQQAKSAPFRNFVRSLPATHILEQPKLVVTTDEQVSLRLQNGAVPQVDLPLTIEPRGLVPEVLSVTLFQDDDVTFLDGTRRTDLTKQPLYFASEFLVPIKLGTSWSSSAAGPARELLRLRVGARTLTGDVIQTDVACQVYQLDRRRISGPSLDNTSLWDIYPGVGNQPARDEEFIGRVVELEQLRTVLVSAKKPTPVLLTGMRRVGKTSLLHEFHRSFRQANHPDAVTVYLSLAEKRAALKDKGKDVSATVFSSIVNALAKRVSFSDPNHEVVGRLQAKLNGEWHTVRKELQACYDQESFSDSLIYFSERLIEWLGGACRRVIYLIDEAETLIVPYQEGGIKRTELEQFLQSLREISQGSEGVGIVLSGSNHIDVFAREYKNAFFGSCLPIDLKGLQDLSDCRHIIAPHRVRPYVQFEQGAIEYAAEISAGMPLFMWQLGAATAALVRSGPATRTDVRRAVQALVLDDGSLPFKAYEILEPLEHMLGLRPQPEPDLLWMLLYRLAQSTSLVAPEANIGFILDQTLLGMGDKDLWRKYLVLLTEIGILEIPRTGEYRFKIPIFAEGFRAQKQWSEFTLRHQRATI